MMGQRPLRFRDAYIAELLRLGAPRIKEDSEEPFYLRSGKRSRMYINHSVLTAQFASRRVLVDALVQLTRLVIGHEEVLFCNVDSKVSPHLTALVADQFAADMIIYKEDALVEREKGDREQFVMPKAKNLPVVFIDDVATTGGTIVSVAAKLKNAYPDIQKICVVVSLIRDPDIFQTALQKYDIVGDGIATLDTVLRQGWNQFSPGQKRAILLERPSLVDLKV